MKIGEPISIPLLYAWKALNSIAQSRILHFDNRETSAFSGNNTYKSIKIMRNIRDLDKMDLFSFVKKFGG